MAATLHLLMLLTLGQLFNVKALGVRIGPLESSYLEGSNVAIRCIITSSKLTDFAWFHNNSTVAKYSVATNDIEKLTQYDYLKATTFLNRGGYRVFRLEMAEISRNLSGHWTCKAWSRSNPRRKQEITKVLNVRYSPDSGFPKCTIESLLENQMRSSCRLICKSQQGNPPVSLGWSEFSKDLNQTNLAYRMGFVKSELNCDALQAPVRYTEVAICNLAQPNQTERHCTVAKEEVYNECELQIFYNVTDKSVNCVLTNNVLRNASLRFNFGNAELNPTTRYSQDSLAISAIFEVNDYIFNGVSIGCTLHWGVYSNKQKSIILDLPIPTTKETVTTARNLGTTIVLPTPLSTGENPLLTRQSPKEGPHLQTNDFITEQSPVMQSTPLWSYQEGTIRFPKEASYQSLTRSFDQQHTVWSQDDTSFTRFLETYTPITASVTAWFASKTPSKMIPMMSTVGAHPGNHSSRWKIESSTTHMISNVKHWTRKQFNVFSSFRPLQGSVTPSQTRNRDNSPYFLTSKVTPTSTLRYNSTSKAYMSSHVPSSDTSLSHLTSSNYNIAENEAKTEKYSSSDKVINFVNVLSSPTAETYEIFKGSTTAPNYSKFFFPNVLIVIICSFCCTIVFIIMCICCLRNKDSEPQIV